MKMKNKRKTMLIAAFAVAIIALAGVGYAATAWTGTTINSGNSANGVYIEVTQLNNEYTGAFTSASPIQVNTYTDEYFNSPIYALKDTGGSAITGDYYGVKIGNGATLVIEPTGATYNTYQINVKAAANAALPTGWAFVLAFGTGQNAKYCVLDAQNSGQVTAVALTNNQIAVNLYIASETLFENMEGTQSHNPIDSTIYAGQAASTSAPTDINGEIFDGLYVTFTVAGETA